MTDQQKWAPLDGFEPSEGKYLFLSGGVYSPDKGCPDWGSNRDEDTYYFFSDSCTDDFLSAHTVDAQKPLPLSITTALGEISHTLFTFDPQDYITVPRCRLRPESDCRATDYFKRQ